MTYNAAMIWLVLGLVLLIAELISGTFVLVFLALGCFIAGIFSFFPPLDEMFAMQLVLCSTISIVGTFVFRKPLQNRFLKSITLKADEGKEIIIDEPIQPHHTARIRYQGTSWQATNIDAQILNKGDRVLIVGIDGNTLLIKKAL